MRVSASETKLGGVGLRLGFSTFSHHSARSYACHPLSPYLEDGHGFGSLPLPLPSLLGGLLGDDQRPHGGSVVLEGGRGQVSVSPDSAAPLLRTAWFPYLPKPD